VGAPAPFSKEHPCSYHRAKSSVPSSAIGMNRHGDRIDEIAGADQAPPGPTRIVSKTGTSHQNYSLDLNDLVYDTDV
jgi:hypothetical protein